VFGDVVESAAVDFANLRPAHLADDSAARIDGRSALVNLDRVKELQPLFYGDYTVILHNGAKLNMSRGFRDRLEKLMAKRL